MLSKSIEYSYVIGKDEILDEDFLSLQALLNSKTEFKKFNY